MPAAELPMRSMLAQSPQLSTLMLCYISWRGGRGDGFDIPPRMSISSPPSPDVVTTPVAEVEVHLLGRSGGDDGIPHGSIEGRRVARRILACLGSRILTARRVAVVKFPRCGRQQCWSGHMNEWVHTKSQLPSLRAVPHPTSHD